MGVVTDSDALLWRSWRAKCDGRAFDALVRPHLAFATAFAQRLGCRGQDADEVVQRTLVALATQTREAPAAVGVRAWIGRSVLQEARMLARSDRRRAAREEVAVRERAARLAPGQQPTEARDEVEVALALLDPEDRHLVELRFLHDLEYREIAFVIGRSPLACRLRVHRALARLKRSMGRSASLLVASIPLPPPAEAADVAISRAVEAAAGSAVAGAAGAVGVGLLMGTASKIAVAAGLLLLVGGGTWVVATRGSTEPPSQSGAPRPDATATAQAPPPGLLGRSGKTAADKDGSLTEATAGGRASDAPPKKGTGSVAGTILFDDGTPMANERVSLTIAPRAEGDTVATDERGRFRFDDQWVGDRPLTLVRPDGTVLILREVALEADRLVTADATLARGVTVSGTVLEAAGRAPVPGAWVTLRRPTDPRSQAVYGGATTDGEGRFRFDHVPPAHVTVEVVRQGREPRLEVLDLPPRDVTLDVFLSPSRPLVVSYEPVPKEAVGESVGWMLTGPVDQTDQFHIGNRGKDGAVVLSENGRGTLDAPPPGRYDLLLFETKTLPSVERSLVVTESEVPEIHVPLAPGSRVVGTLADRDGKPLAGVRVGFSGLDPVSDPTDEGGHVTLARVPAGSQRPTVLLSGIWVRLPPVEVSTADETALSLRMPGTSTLALTLATRAPYGGWLDLKTAGGETVASGNPWTGKVVSLTGLAAGAYVVSLWVRDYIPEKRSVTLEVGQTLDLGEIALAAMPAVPVRVTLPPGTPRPASITVHVRERTPLWEGGVAFNGRIEWDGDGRAWLKGLPAARYRVAIQWTQSANAADLPEFDIDVRDGITVPIDLVLAFR